MASRSVQDELAKRHSRAQRFKVQENTVQYAPLEDGDEQRKRERAKRFGTEFQAKDHSGLQNADILEERKDQGMAVERRTDAVHLYGVDKLSTRDVMSYFRAFAPQSVEWIDDSCCNVVFGDQFSAKRAIIERGRPFSAGNAADLQGLDASDISNLPYLWHKGPDFVRNNRGKVPLIFRMATVEDKKGMAPAKAQRFLWLEGKGHQNGSGKKRGQKRQAFGDADVQMGGVAETKRLKSNAPSQGQFNRASERVDGEERADAAGIARDGSRLLVREPKELNDAELAAERTRQRAEGPSGLFSSSRAVSESSDATEDSGDGSDLESLEDPSRSGSESEEVM